ncbi:MAG: 3-hydroxyacyl-CoA dehydrogenase family protein, partial [Cyclonatronaceae bacterium]
MTSTAYTAPPRPFRRAAVLGAGVMGTQIAAHLANAGLSVLLLDMPTPESKSPDKNAGVQASFKKMLKMKPSPVAGKTVKDRISTGNFEDDLHRIADADWVIEVIIERMDAKKELMAKVEQLVGPDAIISTNTSGLPIHQIASDCSEGFRKRFLGTHFFNPPRYLKLLELIPTPETSPEVVQRVQHFGRVHLGKGVVQAKDTPN